MEEEGKEKRNLKRVKGKEEVQRRYVIGERKRGMKRAKRKGVTEEATEGKKGRCGLCKLSVALNHSEPKKKRRELKIPAGEVKKTGGKKTGKSDILCCGNA